MLDVALGRHVMLFVNAGDLFEEVASVIPDRAVIVAAATTRATFLYRREGRSV